jgi:hypothetical protein
MQQGADCSTSSECLSTPSALPKIGWESYSGSTVAYTKSFAPGARHESIRAESVSHHVAGDVGRSELRTQTVEGRAVIVRDGNDVALCHAHAG